MDKAQRLARSDFDGFGSANFDEFIGHYVGVSRREENYQRASHFLVNPRLLERRVGRKAFASSSINRKITLADGLCQI